jgi:hypothetical protein
MSNQEFEETYKDPENLNEIMEEIKQAPTLKELHEIMMKIWPQWIVGFLDEYSDDYPSLTQNWLELCGKLKTTPKQIVVVQYICFDKPDYNLNRLFGETLTRCGFCVRQQNEIVPCPGCKKALPTDHLYELLKDKGSQVPEEWTMKCAGCDITPPEEEKEKTD